MWRRGLQRGIFFHREPMAKLVRLDRKNVRLRPENYRGRRLYFVTLCFHNRRRFGTNPRRYIKIGAPPTCEKLLFERHSCSDEIGLAKNS